MTENEGSEEPMSEHPNPEEGTLPEEYAKMINTVPEDQIEWMTEMDLEILGVLSKGLILSPSIIAVNIERSREGVSNRLNSLVAAGLVKKIDRGKYSINFDGFAQYDAIKFVDKNSDEWQEYEESKNDG